ncbi:dTDP-4-amino-4,6-dideoxygalactose transaminase [Loktanella fryxellensis]|uniref:dTDP-4-amino-4,6-dideoxygalactose transaminase n=1 Tax=Loktanella fryxellensis TaxID=245187 RepID=A0A1H8H4L0_9RHOB|nr:dTDP-4-amino-4,6-dideoxygalactose transaminase [Loktanella fryxellensis]SEN50904.1 dTDP-4-amino-4,6-dideoxygalactose transaminase [Loktanella fryxellensis]
MVLVDLKLQTAQYTSTNQIPFNRPAPVGNEIAYLEDAIRRGHLAGDGSFTHKCNALIAERTGANKALLTHSCTAALEMAALLCDLGPGDEVVMPSFTFVSTANAVVLRGAVPVFVDIDPDSLNVDPSRVAAAMGPRTKAVFAVHYAGFPADMDALAQITVPAGCLLVEDAAQALGSLYKGRPSGSLGDMATFSFHETKNVVSGEGGALTIMRPDLYDRAEIIREKGTNRSRFFRGQVDKYTWVDVGSSYLPSELIAAFLYAQLENLDMITSRRLALFDRYMEAFAPLERAGRLSRTKIPDDTTGNGHIFYLLLRDLEDRTDFITHMRNRGIVTPFHYVPLHDSPAGQRYGRTSGSMDVTQRISQTQVRLPLFHDLGPQIDDVINTALDYFARTA